MSNNDVSLAIIVAAGAITIGMYWAYFEKKDIPYKLKSETEIYMLLKFSGISTKYHTFVANFDDDQRRISINPTSLTYNSLSGYRSKKPECFKVIKQEYMAERGGPERAIEYTLKDFTKQRKELCSPSDNIE